ncbi:siderophore-interacting protein [Amycolatopsis acidicola]|uniref:Siderophore-interacting protein n=1 Tax=Amycolatopsis acidicola TaxID=2596893 RepID=A0A5N0US80_9PSEU|nr:siderophore-interacting protein [Amycolatopsis acidicola]KAA9154662.1 siderophore-interacting protein [Amycolatopsis acidicola]
MSRFDRAVLALLRAPTYPLTVREVEDLTGHCRRVHFAAPELLAEREITPTFWLRLWIPSNGQEYQRAYTVTRVRPEENLFAVDFVLHDTPGIASAWARGAEPGAELRATVYTGELLALEDPPPKGYLLLGDSASLPAINEILAALPADVPARIFLKQQHEDDARLPVYTRDGDKLGWTTAELTEAIKDQGDLDGWHAWVATESGVTRRLKALLQKQFGLPRTAIKARGYWIEGKPMGRAA